MTNIDLSELVDFITKQFDAQKRDFNRLESRVGGLDGRFDRFESHFRIARLDVQERLTTLEN